jgi:hypothetical protein
MASAETVSGESEGVVERILRSRSRAAIVIDQIRDLIITDKLSRGGQLVENTIFASPAASAPAATASFARANRSQARRRRRR